MNSRNIALEIIISILEEKKPLHSILLTSLNGIEDKREKAFVARLVRGCVERAYSIDRVIDSVSSVKVKKQKPVIRNILRSGVYQILFMDSVTDFAACDESVKLAGKRGFRSLQGFVNGVLRNICRNKDNFLKDISDGALSMHYSVPDWIVDVFCSSYGKDRTEKAFNYFLSENEVSVRINTSKISPADFEKRIDGYRAEKNRYLDNCYRLYDFGSIEDIPEFKEGLFTIQDMSSALVGHICDNLFKAGSVKGKKALDLCAAPGGKSLYLADIGMEVTSCDISEMKLDLIRENVNRCRFDNIELKQNDATVYNTEFEGKFDLVLCDLPCSGLGIIGKKPDIKYNITPEKVDELAGLQKSILKNAVKYVKPGGYLIYSTCTVTPKENTENVKYLLKQSGIEALPVKKYLPEGIEAKQEEDNFIQILPGEYDSDGFFISLYINTLGTK